jgi:hypothetical protein
MPPAAGGPRGRARARRGSIPRVPRPEAISDAITRAARRDACTKDRVRGGGRHCLPH